MAVRKVVTYGHPVLKKISSDITDFSDIESSIKDLFDTMYEFDGIGLAANQLGVDKRIFVVDISHMEESDSDSNKPLVFINGRVENPSGSCVDSEGCLSLPGIRIDVKRLVHLYKKWSKDIIKMELQLRKFGIDNANSWQQIRRAYIKYGVVQDAEEYAGSNKIESEILMRYCQEEENWDAVDLLNLLVHEGHFLN